jgi:hypothetical protein
MKRMNPKIDGRVLGAGVALGLAGLLFVTVTARAVVTSPLPALSDVAPASAERGGDREASVELPAPSTVDPTAPTPSRGTETAPREFIPQEVIRTAAEGAPFQPDRQAPGARYRLPDEPIPAPPALPPLPPELPPPPGFRLLGTIASGTAADGAVVVLTVDNETPRILALGESYMGYTVTQVVGDRAMLSGQGRNLSLTVAAPQATVASAAPGANRGRGAQGNANNQNPAQQIQELMRGGGQGMQNMTPEQRQRLIQEAEGAAREMLQQLMRGGGAAGQGGQGGQGVIQFRLPGGGGAATVIQGGGAGGQGGATQRQIIVRPGGGGD